MKLKLLIKFLFVFSLLQLNNARPADPASLSISEMEEQLLDWSQDELLNFIISNAEKRNMLDDEEGLIKLYSLVKYVMDSCYGCEKKKTGGNKAGKTSAMDNYYYRKMLF